MICENNRLVKFYVCESCWSATRIFRYIRWSYGSSVLNGSMANESRFMFDALLFKDWYFWYRTLCIRSRVYGIFPLGPPANTSGRPNGPPANLDLAHQLTNTSGRPNGPPANLDLAHQLTTSQPICNPCIFFKGLSWIKLKKQSLNISCHWSSKNKSSFGRHDQPVRRTCSDERGQHHGCHALVWERCRLPAWGVEGVFAMAALHAVWHEGTWICKRTLSFSHSCLPISRRKFSFSIF